MVVAVPTMASSCDTRLVDRLYAFASALPLQHLNKPVPHFLLDVHDAMIPHIENLQLSLEERGWASVALPPYLSTLQARLAITGLIISLTIFLISAALPRGKKGESQKQESNTRQEGELETKAVEEVVGEISLEKQEIRGGEEVEEVKLEREEEEVKLKTQPVPASPRTASITSTSIAAVIENPSAPVPAEATPASPLSAPATTTPASPVPVSQQASNSDADPRSPRPAPSTAHSTSPIRTRSSTSSIPVRVPTTPARASSYPTAINTAVNHTRHASTPIARTATSPTSPASAKVVAASYAWVMSEDLEWDDRAGGSSDETGEHSDNSNSYSDDDDDDEEDAKNHAKDSDSPHSRRSLEDELQAAGYKGAAAGELDDSDNDSDVSEAREQEQEDKMNNGALHPRRHSHTSDIEARYEAWRKTRSEGGGGHHLHHNRSNSTKTTTSALGSGIGGIGGIASGMGGIRKTRSHHSRKDSVLENQNNGTNNNNNSSPSTGRSSLSMSTRSMTRHALLQRKRSSALKPWARKRKEDFGEWLKKKTTATATTTTTATNATNNGTTTAAAAAAITSTTKE